MIISVGKRRLSFAVEQLIRILCMKFILAPAAYVLPRKLALTVADVFTIFLLIIPRLGLGKYWEMRNAFGKGRLESLKLAYGWLSRPFRDHIVIKRMKYKRENPHKWRIVEKNADRIERLRSSGESYIVATGHFQRESLLSITSPAVTYGHPVHVVKMPPVKIKSLYDLRIRIQFGSWQKPDYAGWGRDSELVFVGSKEPSFETLAQRLSEPGNVVFILVDAPWKKSLPRSYERPFAGFRNRAFALGAAQLARLARCPVVSCVYSLDPDGTIIIDWGTPIRFAGDGAMTDIEVMDKLLDVLEIAVGERPTQYILDIGGERRWDPQGMMWRDLSE